MALVTSIHNLNSKFPSKLKNTLKLLTGRVTDVILDPSSVPSEVYQKIGGNIGIGTVYFDLLDYPTTNKVQYSNLIAYPLFPNNIQYPLPNELISIIYLPAFINSDLENLQNTPNMGSAIAYYFSTINIWRNFHHNIFPSTNSPEEEELNNSNEKRSLEEIGAGAYNTDTPSYNTPTNGVNFSEKSLLRDLQPYVGDIIYKGRWGQSIRFGSTVKGGNNPNSWSSEGEEGSPITIIRNGQNLENNNQIDYTPQVEDINKDISSIYLTSTQKILFSPSSVNYNSYDTSFNNVKKPSPPSIFDKNQIILTSNRLFFNASEDSILLSAKESINLSTLSSINLESQKGIILTPGEDSSSQIKLGSINAQESVILGDKFLADFNQLLSQLKSLSLSLQSDIGTSVPFVPNPSILIPAKSLELTINSLQQSIESYKSKTSKTI